MVIKISSGLKPITHEKHQQLSTINSSFFESGHFETFKLLIQECENRNINFKNATDIMGMSLLHFAAMNRKPKNTEILKMLLQKDINVNSIAKDNTTALDYAASTGWNIAFFQFELYFNGRNIV